MANLHITNSLNAESPLVMDYLIASSLFTDHNHTRQHSKPKNQISQYVFTALLHSHFKEMGYDKLEA